MTSSMAIYRILWSFMYVKTISFLQKCLLLFQLFILYTVENDDKHKRVKCKRVNMLGLINTEHANFETTPSFHH